MYKVMKRDGSISEFKLDKIIDAITKAFIATDIEYSKDVIDVLALKVTADFASKIVDHSIAVEDIQDSVESVLGFCGYGNVAKKYILYRKNREKKRNMKSSVEQFKRIVNEYFSDSSCINLSTGGLSDYNAKLIVHNYWMNDVFTNDVVMAIEKGYLEVKNLDTLSFNQACFNLETLMIQGLGIEHQVFAKPAKHVDSFLHQLINFINIVQYEWNQPLIFKHFDRYLAAFVKKDQVSKEALKKHLEMFIFGINYPTYYGIKHPKCILQFDVKVDTTLGKKKCVIAQETMPFTYQDLQEEMDCIHEVLLEILLEKDGMESRFKNPILVYPMQSFPLSDAVYRFAMEHSNQVIFQKEEVVKGQLVEVIVHTDEQVSLYTELAIKLIEDRKAVIQKLYDECLYPYSYKYLDCIDYESHVMFYKEIKQEVLQALQANTSNDIRFIQCIHNESNNALDLLEKYKDHPYVDCVSIPILEKGIQLKSFKAFVDVLQTQYPYKAYRFTQK